MQRTHEDPVEAACGYWRRRGLPTLPSQVAVAPGAPLLLLATLAAADPAGAGGGTVLVTRPSATLHAAQARLLGRPVRAVPVPAECGGIPDPFALQEAVRRSRQAGESPQALVVSVADDPTGTAALPELLRDACEMAADEELLVVSDETWRDSSHEPAAEVVVSPAEMLGGHPGARVAVLAGTGPAAGPDGPAAAAVRFSGSVSGIALADGVRELLRRLHAPLPSAAADAAVRGFSEAPPERAERASLARVRGALAQALHEAVRDAGAAARPPRTGAHLYADLEPLRPALAARGIRDAAGLEAELVRRLGPFVRGGHRFCDEPHELRVRLSTGLLTARAPQGGGRSAEALLAATPNVRETPAVARALDRVRTVLADLTAPR